MQSVSALRPVGGPTRLHQRHGHQQAARGRLQVARAEPFNEGAAQVRRLVDRDRKEINLDELEAQFAEDPAAAPASPAASDDAAAAPAAPAAPADEGRTTAQVNASFQVSSSAADKTPVSPFGPSSSSSGGSNPFGSGGAQVKRPFSEPAGLSPNMPTPVKDTTPWWTKVTLTQIVIVASFTTIIALMVSTFFFVLSTGAIRFNE